MALLALLTLLRYAEIKTETCVASQLNSKITGTGKWEESIYFLLQSQSLIFYQTRYYYLGLVTRGLLDTVLEPKVKENCSYSTAMM